MHLLTTITTIHDNRKHKLSHNIGLRIKDDHALIVNWSLLYTSYIELTKFIQYKQTDLEWTKVLKENQFL